MSKKEFNATVKRRNALHQIARSQDLHLEPSPTWSFNYNIQNDNKIAWSCPLLRMKCMHETQRGTKCQRWTSFTLGLCWQHLKLAAHLTVRQTTLKDKKGKRFKYLGLFVCSITQPSDAIVFRKGNVITVYLGELVNNKILKTRYPGDETAPYTYASRADQKDALDSACVRGVGSLANTCTSQNPGCVNNTKIMKSTPKYFPKLIATKNIKNNQEIFTSYGPAYFRKKSVHKLFKTKSQSGVQYNKVKYKCKTRQKSRKSKKSKKSPSHKIK